MNAAASTSAQAERGATARMGVGRRTRRPRRARLNGRQGPRGGKAPAGAGACVPVRAARLGVRWEQQAGAGRCFACFHPGSLLSAGASGGRGRHECLVAVGGLGAHSMVKSQITDGGGGGIRHTTSKAECYIPMIHAE